MSRQNKNNLRANSTGKPKKDFLIRKQSDALTDETIRTTTPTITGEDECFVWGSVYTPQVWIYMAVDGSSKERVLTISGPGAVDLANYLGWAMLRHFGPSPQAIWLARAALIKVLDDALMNPADESWNWKLSRTDKEAAEGREWIEKTRENFCPSAYQWSTKEEWIKAWKKCVEKQAAEFVPSSLTWHGDELF